METVKTFLENRESKLKLYEKKFNLLKNNITINNPIKTMVNNCYNDDYLLKFNLNRINSTTNLLLLLKQELENEIPKNINSLSELKKYINNLFNKYNKLINHITEDKWTLYNQFNQTKYELNINEFVIDNSISLINKNDENLIFFLNHVLRIAELASSTINYKVHTRFYDDDTHEICWLIFVFEPI